MSFSSIDFLSVGYRERKSMELKLTEIALNRSKNYIGKTTTEKGVQVGIFLLKIRRYFLIEVEIIFFPYKSL